MPVRTMLTFTYRDAFCTDSTNATQNTAAHVQAFCIKALPIASTPSFIAESGHTFVFYLLLALFICFVSLFLKALLVKASPRVFNTEFWFSRNYLLTRVSMYWESHRQFRSHRDLLVTLYSTGVQTIAI